MGLAYIEVFLGVALFAGLCTTFFFAVFANALSDWTIATAGRTTAALNAATMAVTMSFFTGASFRIPGAYTLAPIPPRLNQCNS
jgi:hypothetical protein